MRSEAEQSSVDRNRVYYEELTAGRESYWRYMAAPRFRVATLLSLIRKLQPASLIDLGCGNGQLLREIARELPDIRLCGADLSQSQIDQNVRTMPEKSWYAVDLQNRASLPDALVGGFDCVTASEIIEHLDDPATFLRNAAEVATPHGTLLVTTQSGRIGQTERAVGHLRHFTAAEIDSLLRSNGWEPVRIWNSGFPFHDLSKWAANRSPEKSLRAFGTRPYGAMEKAVCYALRFAFLFNSGRRGAQLFAVARRGV